VRASVDQLRHGSLILEEMVDSGELKIIGAEYSIETGIIEFFEDD
jgi:carbonic anhydrase